MSGGIIEAPCVNNSENLTAIRGNTLFVGFIHLKSLEKKIASAIAPERERNGPFKSLNDFLRRVAPGLEQARLLIRIGAFRFTGKNKQKLLWEALLYYSQAAARIPATEELFDIEPSEYPLPVFEYDDIENAFDEIELIGFPLQDPFHLLPAADHGDTHAAHLMKRIGANVVMTGYVVTTKDTGTKGGQLMHFGTFQLTTEGIDEPIRALTEACRTSNVAPDRKSVV